ncbi:hypothetical protein EV186_103594 [Labedaea rhizosphaerae]|uniref:Uncharacterized protein n=1 Tax=Labedaea rhizosphaerae TaxID=598644 RepID=A0A4R6SCK2_LABRH|nr:hypothetical protein EV186_103594 [Labedaea rhizosphaerae]
MFTWHPIIRHRSRAMQRRERRLGELLGAPPAIPTTSVPMQVDKPSAPRSLRHRPPIVRDARTHIVVSGSADPSHEAEPGTAPRTAIGRVCHPEATRSVAPTAWSTP